MSQYLIAADPAKHSYGWAKFFHNELIGCGLDIGRNRRMLADWVHKRFGDVKQNGVDVVIELPQVYRQRNWKGDPNDLIEVGLTVGMIAQEAGGVVRTVTPSQWKGQRPKKVDNAFTLSKLAEQEQAIFDDCGVISHLRHNVIDAIGIGLWRLKRR